MNSTNFEMLLMSHRRGTAEILGVDVVGRDGGLREIVEQVVGEHLDRRHRQERQEDAGAEHAEHVAEVGARAHLDIFGDVAEDLAPLDHAFPSTSRLFSSKMMSADSLAMSTARIHGDADVGGLQGRAVVDAIAQESDDVPLAMKASITRAFCAGETLAKTAVLSASSAKRPRSSVRCLGQARCDPLRAQPRGRSCG